jgi:antitoxin component YwqK of YwqJK toxin-antitoxin module
MGVESDSSVLIYKGKMHEVFYFSDPGKIVKKARYNNQGSLWFVDTLVSENNFFRILSVTQEGWSSQIGHLDTSKQVMHTTRFYAPGKKSTEYWTDLRGVNQESKEYYPETGTIKVHLKNEGQVSVVDTNAKPSETPKHRIVKLAYRWSYNENGALIKKERLENGVVVEGN